MPDPSYDSLLPPQMAIKAEDVGVAKCKQNNLAVFTLAILAGAFIALGAIFYTTVVTGSAEVLPWGVARLIGAVAFCLGLILVIVGGAELFTGNNLLVMAFVSKKITFAQLIKNWTLVYAGNLVGSVGTAGLMFMTHQYQMAGGKVGVTVLNIANAKCQLTFMEGFTRGIYCNVLVCLAVWLCFSCRTTGDKILAILFPITAFVAAGFEHCVANMYFVPIGMLVKQFAPAEFWTAAGTSADAFGQMNLSNFLVGNLLPVTLGNIVGGSVFVAVVYWVVYRRPAKSSDAKDSQS
jgi:formate transporter